MLMKNVLKLIFSSLLVFPFTMNAQQQDFPAGTTPNEHNINGADYPRIGEDRRVHFRIHAPNAQKVEISFRGEMTKMCIRDSNSTIRFVQHDTCSHGSSLFQVIKRNRSLIQVRACIQRDNTCFNHC